MIQILSYTKKKQDDKSNNKNSENEILLLPTFFLQGKRSPLNLLYGSCRKLHGKGEDCLALADEIIASSVEDLNKRPSALFLTGDQIYADDVARYSYPIFNPIWYKLARTGREDPWYW